jgi:acetyl-CoA acetyltransferase
VKSQRVAVVGVGYSPITRHSEMSVDQLTVRAARAAMDDAGLTPADIDGVTTFSTYQQEIVGQALRDAAMLGIAPLNWFSTIGAQSPAFVHAAIHSVAAIRAGLCHTALTLRVIKQMPSSAGLPSLALSSVSGDPQFTRPFGGGSPAQWAGLLMQRYMAEFGATEEDFGRQAVAQREFALLNDNALIREPLDLEGYLNSRYISKPLRLLDCDYPCDSGSAVIFTTEERARDLCQTPIIVETEAVSATRDLNFEVLQDMVRTAPVHCSEQLWSKSDFSAQDLDVAELYDGFSVIVFQWLEALGLCAPGEAPAFVAEGNTGRGGRIPVNTDGGARNVGRRHGANFCIEAVQQLRGHAGERQVPDARVAVYTNAVGPFAGAMLLTGS